MSVALVWSALRVTRLHSPTSQSGPLRPILSVRSSNVNTNAKSKPIPDDHHREHVDADRHILDHWKGRGAQVPPQHDAQHDAVGGHAAAGNEAENGNSRADTPRFLAFHGIAQGQGAGNIVSGLLGTPATTGQRQGEGVGSVVYFESFRPRARRRIPGNSPVPSAHPPRVSNSKRPDLTRSYFMFHRLSNDTAAHLYGIEFNRVVCLTEGMRNFWDAYEAIDPDAIQHCPKLALQRPPTKGGRNTFDVLTYGSPPNECQLQQLLQSDEPVVYMGGNTYPRWPEVCACARKPEKTKLEWYCRKRTAETSTHTC